MNKQKCIEQKNNMIKILILLVFFILTGCSNITRNSSQTHDINGSTESSYKNKQMSIQTKSKGEEKSDLNGIAYNDNDLYVVVGSKGRVLTSTDGVSWIIRQSGTDKNLRSVIWGKKQFVSVGDEGIILISMDGVNWETVNSNTNTCLYKVKCDGKFYYSIIGNGTILTSEDGNLWTKKEIPISKLNNATDDKLIYHIADILWDGKQYIAVGDGNFILTSEMLDKWVVRVPNSRGTGMYCNVEWNGKRYVAVGDHLAMSTSLNGHKWTVEGLRINDIESVNDYYTLCLNSVIWGRDKFIVVGQKGLILESKDGLEWSVLSNYTIAGLNQVIWDGKQFISVGDNDTIVNSTDGVKWVATKS